MIEALDANSADLPTLLDAALTRSLWSRKIARLTLSTCASVRLQIATHGRNRLSAGYMLHVASTALLTFYRVCAKRGSLLANVVGIVVHDHWKPYYTMQSVLHVLCNAHHLRELKALVEIEKEDWARKMQRLLRRALSCGESRARTGRSFEVPIGHSTIAWYQRLVRVLPHGFDGAKSVVNPS